MNTMTLLEWLCLHYPDSSKTTLRSWIKQGKVTVGGKLIKISTTFVDIDQKIIVNTHSKRSNGEISIVFKDKHIIVIDKPEGLLSVSTHYDIEENAHKILKMQFKPTRVFVVHRLDQDTSGLMLFAFTEEARDVLKKYFEKHEIKRTYTAIVEGHLTHPKGTWKNFLYEDANYVVKTTDDKEGGKLAITHYTVVKEIPGYSWLSLELETGRKNQIRVQCQKAGHPIIGDSKYGSKKNPLNRIGLHAHQLSFVHPITGKKLKFESSLPSSFTTLFRSK